MSIYVYESESHSVVFRLFATPWTIESRNFLQARKQKSKGCKLF